MADTREMGKAEYAEHMRVRRGAPPPDSRVILDRGLSATGEGDWMCWVTVSDRHPWYGNEAEECTDGGRLDLEILLDDGEKIEASGDTKNDKWMLNAFVGGEERARQLLTFLCEAAEACVSVRLSGTVTSSR